MRRVGEGETLAAEQPPGSGRRGVNADSRDQDAFGRLFFCERFAPTNRRDNAANP